MIDIASETLIPLRDVPKLLPLTSRGNRVHISIVYRWVQRGLGGVKLEAIKIGGRRCTSVEAIQRWSERRTAGGSGAPTPVLTAKVRQKQIQRAARDVEAILGTGRTRQHHCDDDGEEDDDPRRSSR